MLHVLNELLCGKTMQVGTCKCTGRFFTQNYFWGGGAKMIGGRDSYAVKHNDFYEGFTTLWATFNISVSIWTLWTRWTKINQFIIYRKSRNFSKDLILALFARIFNSLRLCTTNKTFRLDIMCSMRNLSKIA